MDYGRVHRLQHRVREGVLSGRLPEVVLRVEHPPVITLGRAADEKNVRVELSALAHRGVEVHRVERGGDVTYHGPGQVVVYPVFRIGSHVKEFVAALAEAARATLSDFKIPAQWDESRPGLWVDGRKIAAVGIHVNRGVSIHGLALNVSVDLAGFQLIVPCGIAGAEVTSMEKVLGVRPGMEEVGGPLVRHLLDFTERNEGKFLRDHELFSYLDGPD
jgi:lipoate-protein ligase B